MDNYILPLEQDPRDKDKNRYSSQNPWEMNLNHERNLTTFLFRNKVASRQKLGFFARELHKNKMKAFQMLRRLNLPLKLAHGIAKLLIDSGLRKGERSLILKLIKSILMHFQDLYREISLGKIMHLWDKLPLALKKFIIALQILKVEIVHNLKLVRDRDLKRLNKPMIALNKFEVKRYRNNRKEFLRDVSLNRHRRDTKDEKHYVKNNYKKYHFKRNAHGEFASKEKHY